MPTGNKPISRYEYTITVYVLGEKQLQQKSTAAGITGTWNKDTHSRLLRKLLL